MDAGVRAVTPTGNPAAPGKPSVAALNEAVRVGVAPQASGDISGFRYECSSDGGATWPATPDASPTPIRPPRSAA